MGAMAGVPREVKSELLLEIGGTVRNGDQPSSAFSLNRPDAALDHGQAAVLADGAEPLPDAAATAPSSEFLGDELPALVGDEIPGLMAYLHEESLKESANGTRGRLAAADRESHHPPRAVVDGDTHPPAERPHLRQGERNPRCPEAE
jgi:hypothetical protein